ncbi:MAG: hypothetical protein ACFCVH_13105 [Alphaproteobacteria bacterium]
MGFSVNWVAIKGATADEACAAMGFERTGEFANDPTHKELVGCELPNGMYLVQADGRGPFTAFSETYAERQALPNEAIHFMCYDTVMMTTMGCVADGERRWSIMRYESGEPFELEGEIPAEYHRLLAQAKEKQATAGDEVDYLYDVTAQLGFHLTGYQHDRVQEDIRFEVLRALPSSPYAPVAAPGRTGSARHSSKPLPWPGTGGRPWWKFW